MSPARANLETVTGLLTLPLPVAAQIIGTSVATLRRSVPVQARGYRTKTVTVAALREFLEACEEKPSPKHTQQQP